MSLCEVVLRIVMFCCPRSRGRGSMHGEAMLYPVSGRIDMPRPARCLAPLPPMRRTNS